MKYNVYTQGNMQVSSSKLRNSNEVFSQSSTALFYGFF